MTRSEGVTSFIRANGRSGRRLQGYIMISEGKKECQVGPWICEPDRIDVARDLLEAVLTKFKKKTVTTATPLENANATYLLRNTGFVKRMDVTRMRKGRNLYNGKPKWVFAVGGLERG